MCVCVCVCVCLCVCVCVCVSQRLFLLLEVHVDQTQSDSSSDWITLRSSALHSDGAEAGSSLDLLRVKLCKMIWGRVLLTACSSAASLHAQYLKVLFLSSSSLQPPPPQTSSSCYVICCKLVFLSSPLLIHPQPFLHQVRFTPESIFGALSPAVFSKVSFIVLKEYLRDGF